MNHRRPTTTAESSLPQREFANVNGEESFLLAKASHHNNACAEKCASVSESTHHC